MASKVQVEHIQGEDRSQIELMMAVHRFRVCGVGGGRREEGQTEKGQRTTGKHCEMRIRVTSKGPKYTLNSVKLSGKRTEG